MNKGYKYRLFRFISLLLLLVFTTELFFPTVSYALTSGPSQPEVQSFEPVGTTEMVDLFTGDFNYNIPLFELPGPNGGYPFNIAYNSGITMDQEASWVGLGWNLNPGAITRDMRGLPDEFNGGPEHRVTHERDIKDNVSFGVGVGADLEIFGGALAEIAQLSLGIGVYYNNYKGVGYSIDPSLSFHTASKDGMNGAIGFDFSLDSQEGVGVNASLSLSDNYSNTEQTRNGRGFISAGVGYNSKVGLTQLTLSGGVSDKDKLKNGGERHKNNTVSASLGGGSRLSLAGIAYTPSVGNPMEGRSISLSFKAGGALFGAFGNGYINGYFSTQYLKYKTSSAPAYGYLYLQNATSSDAIMDFNREKDGMLRKNSPNLACPSMTYDIYNIAGQGVAGMYRPYRNDIGVLKDPTVESKTVGGSAGVDVGPGPSPHIGANVTVNYSKSVSGKWEDQNDVDGLESNKYHFTSAAGLYEPAYFKIHGEHTSDSKSQLEYIGNEKAVRMQLVKMSDGVDTKYKALNKFSYPDKDISNANPVAEFRRKRNNVVQPIDNDYTKGLYVINAEGVRYNYSKPVYNNKHVEAQFSIGAGHTMEERIVNTGSPGGDRPNYTQQEASDKFYSRTTIPKYAHSYLLEEVLGADYVDADGSSTLTKDDFGYWVKFSYAKTSDNYKWRAPFEGANYMRGLNTTPADDKGSYMYGGKEMYYLDKAETKTHVAVFNRSVRKDARGAKNELQDKDGENVEAFSYKLDNIKLYTRSEFYLINGNVNTNAKPFQTIHFQYTYDLCKGLPNNDGTADPMTSSNNDGKLTLKKIWFTYENNTRGGLSPYEFDYHEGNTSANANENPDYDTHKYDRWGNYKRADTDDEKTMVLYMPYVDQFSKSEIDKVNELNRNMAVWNLKEITLPSGGKITVDYESDDYGYVQNKTAMQMFKIASLKPYNYSEEDRIHITHSRYASGFNRRVYFDLEELINKAVTQVDKEKVKKKIGDDYLDDTRKLYFRVFMKLRRNSDQLEDFVSGYADITDWGVDEESENSSGKYTRGWVEMAHEGGFHPFSSAAWQHMRTNEPGLAGLGKYDADPNSSKADAVKKIKSLSSIIPTIGQIFAGFRSYALSNDWGEYIADLNKSVIRLNSPDKCKFGGGVRVKQIMLSDEWEASTNNSEKTSKYGQVYDYTMEENGRTISSGVAAYEPMIGGDEIALRSVKEYPERIPFKTDNNLFFELPVNESYYPGPHVGYRKVTVKSLATHYSRTTEDDVTGGLNIPAGILTTGATVHEFYTAKDFPVITDETAIEKRIFDLYIPIPFIGQITVNKMTASQGYSIVQNDMHGKLKKVSNYKQDENGKIIDSPISYIEYNYKCEAKRKSGSSDVYYELDNEVPVITGDKRGIISKPADVTKVIGQDYDFFTDMRENRTFSSTGGVKFNNDNIIIGIFWFPAFVPWPSVGTSTTEVRTVVTNKIIHKSGILISTVAYSDGSTVKTENKYFDELTGQPILTTLTNNFDAPIYNYKIPAHFNYEGMGPAYKNIGYSFQATLSTDISTSGFYTIPATNDPQGVLVPGDELISGSNRLVFVERKDNLLRFYCKSYSGSSGAVTLTIIKSGRKNQITAIAGNITTLGSKTDATKGDPTIQSNRMQ